jgi:malyl-CoA/(S)-citramalyl-CoA lyase
MMIRTDRLTRSMLFVPGSNLHMIEKAAVSQADVVCLDLEDAVASDHKVAARTNTIQALQQLDFGLRVKMVRINALDTPYAYRDVIEVVEACWQTLDLIMLPKTNGAVDVLFIDTLLKQIEANVRSTRSIGIEAQIETAAGFMNLREIAQSSERLEALIFGPGDYAASMRMPLSNIGVTDEFDALYPGHRWHAVMHSIVAAARANGLRCMDGPFSDYQDNAGFEQSGKIARALGFDGKQCIHPSQLAAANQIFSPSPAEVEWAQEVVSAYQQSSAAGRGAFSYKGKMVDAANIRMAETVLRQQNSIDARNKEIRL